MTRFRMPLVLLAAGAVLLTTPLAGCNRPAAAPAPAAVSDQDQVDDLLTEVDRQLNDDAQPAADQD
ncbi:MAG: hypothetical protein ABW022_27310 [Actinoplanes sp.]